MVPMAQIVEFSDRLVTEYKPRKVVLFGSYARGTANIHSDIDLLVILPFKGKPAYISAEMRVRLRPPFPIDLIVRTPETVRERLAIGDGFMRDILENGKVLYETADN
jgi:uncharacterized protein